MATDKVLNLSEYRKSVFETVPKNKQKRLLNIQTEIEQRLITIKTNIYEIGKLLSTAKKILRHGSFERWIEETFGKELPYPTAALFKSIYETFSEQPQTVRMLPVTFLMELKQESFPDTIREMVNSNPEAFRESDLKVISQAYKEFKENKIDLGDFTRLAKKQIAIGVAILEGEAHVRNSKRSNRTIRHGFRDLQSAIRKMRTYSTKIRTFFPPTTDKHIIEHNILADQVKESILDDDLLKEIDLVIQELENLKIDIENRRGFFKQRLVKEDGIIKKKVMDAR